MGQLAAGWPGWGEERRGEERRGEETSVAAHPSTISIFCPPYDVIVRHQSEAKGQFFHSDLIVSHTETEKWTQEGKREGCGRSCFNIDTDDWRPHTNDECVTDEKTHNIERGMERRFQRRGKNRHWQKPPRSTSHLVMKYLPSTQPAGEAATGDRRNTHSHTRWPHILDTAA